MKTLSPLSSSSCRNPSLQPPSSSRPRPCTPSPPPSSTPDRREDVAEPVCTEPTLSRRPQPRTTPLARAPRPSRAHHALRLPLARAPTATRQRRRSSPSTHDPAESHAAVRLHQPRRAALLRPAAVQQCCFDVWQLASSSFPDPQPRGCRVRVVRVLGGFLCFEPPSSLIKVFGQPRCLEVLGCVFEFDLIWV